MSDTANNVIATTSKESRDLTLYRVVVELAHQKKWDDISESLQSISDKETLDKVLARLRMYARKVDGWFSILVNMASKDPALVDCACPEKSKFLNRSLTFVAEDLETDVTAVVDGLKRARNMIEAGERIREKRLFSEATSTISRCRGSKLL